MKENDIIICIKNILGFEEHQKYKINSILISDTLVTILRNNNDYEMFALKNDFKIHTRTLPLLKDYFMTMRQYNLYLID